MAIRCAGREDKEQVKALWQYAFNETESFTEYFFEKRYREEYNLVVAEEEEVRASLLLNPYTLRHQPGEETVRYVVGISVWPEYRGMKYTTKLLKAAFEQLYEQGESLSLLMPIDTGIYRRYGYENCFDMEVFEIDMEKIEPKRREGYFFKRVRSAEDQSLADAAGVYEKRSRLWQNCLIRDRKYFADFFEEVRQERGEILVCYDGKALPKGYMVFYPKNEGGETGFVREMLVLEAAVYDVFLRLIQSHKTQIKKVLIHQPEDSLFMDFLGNNNQIRRQKRPFLMARILNLQKLLESLPVSRETDLRLRVSDSMIPQNDGLFHLTARGAVRLSQDQEADLALSIGEMTRLYMGRLSPDELCFLKGEDWAQEKRRMLRGLFPKKTSYINDYI